MPWVNPGAGSGLLAWAGGQARFDNGGADTGFVRDIAGRPADHLDTSRSKRLVFLRVGRFPVRLLVGFVIQLDHRQHTGVLAADNKIGTHAVDAGRIITNRHYFLYAFATAGLFFRRDQRCVPKISPRVTGTALPICRIASPHAPLMMKSSGNV